MAVLGDHKDFFQDNHDVNNKQEWMLPAQADPKLLLVISSTKQRMDKNAVDLNSGTHQLVVKE